MGSVCVSSCRCCVFLSAVHPVVIMSAVFCVFCSLLMFVSDAIGDHMVETYSSMGPVMALYFGEDRFLLFSPCCRCACFECLYCLACFCCCDFYVSRS